MIKSLLSLLILAILISGYSTRAMGFECSSGFKQKYVAGKIDGPDIDKIFRFKQMRDDLLAAMDAQPVDSEKIECLQAFYEQSLKASSDTWDKIQKSGRCAGPCADEYERSKNYINNLDAELKKKVAIKLDVIRKQAEKSPGSEKMCDEVNRPIHISDLKEVKANMCCGKPDDNPQGGAVRGIFPDINYNACIGKIEPSKEEYASVQGVSQCLAKMAESVIKGIFQGIKSLMTLPYELWSARSALWELSTSADARQALYDKLKEMGQQFVEQRVTSLGSCLNSYEQSMYICSATGDIMGLLIGPAVLSKVLKLVSTGVRLTGAVLGDLLKAAPGGQKVLDGLSVAQKASEKAIGAAKAAKSGVVNAASDAVSASGKIAEKTLEKLKSFASRKEPPMRDYGPNGRDFGKVGDLGGTTYKDPAKFPHIEPEITDMTQAPDGSWVPKPTEGPSAGAAQRAMAKAEAAPANGAPKLLEGPKPTEPLPEGSMRDTVTRENAPPAESGASSRAARGAAPARAEAPPVTAEPAPVREPVATQAERPRAARSEPAAPREPTAPKPASSDVPPQRPLAATRSAAEAAPRAAETQVGRPLAKMGDRLGAAERAPTRVAEARTAPEPAAPAPRAAPVPETPTSAPAAPARPPSPSGPSSLASRRAEIAKEYRDPNPSSVDHFKGEVERLQKDYQRVSKDGAGYEQKYIDEINQKRIQAYRDLDTEIAKKKLDKEAFIQRKLATEPEYITSEPAVSRAPGEPSAGGTRGRAGEPNETASNSGGKPGAGAAADAKATGAQGKIPEKDLVFKDKPLEPRGEPKPDLVRTMEERVKSHTGSDVAALRNAEVELANDLHSADPAVRASGRKVLEDLDKKVLEKFQKETAGKFIRYSDAEGLDGTIGRRAEGLLGNEVGGALDGASSAKLQEVRNKMMKDIEQTVSDQTRKNGRNSVQQRPLSIGESLTESELGSLWDGPGLPKERPSGRFELKWADKRDELKNMKAAGDASKLVEIRAKQKAVEKIDELLRARTMAETGGKEARKLIEGSRSASKEGLEEAKQMGEIRSQALKAGAPGKPLNEMSDGEIRKVLDHLHEVSTGEGTGLQRARGGGVEHERSLARSVKEEMRLDPAVRARVDKIDSAAQAERRAAAQGARQRAIAEDLQTRAANPQLAALPAERAQKIDSLLERLNKDPHSLTSDDIKAIKAARDHFSKQAGASAKTASGKSVSGIHPQDFQREKAFETTLKKAKEEIKARQSVAQDQRNSAAKSRFEALKKFKGEPAPDQSYMPVALEESEKVRLMTELQARGVTRAEFDAANEASKFDNGRINPRRVDFAKLQSFLDKVRGFSQGELKTPVLWKNIDDLEQSANYHLRNRVPNRAVGVDINDL